LSSASTTLSTRPIPLLLNAYWTSFKILGNTNRFGRRTFLLNGACGCIVSLIFLAPWTAGFVGTTNKADERAAVFFIFFYIFWWYFFIDATQYAYLSEIFLEPSAFARHCSGPQLLLPRLGRHACWDSCCTECSGVEVLSGSHHSLWLLHLPHISAVLRDPSAHTRRNRRTFWGQGGFTLVRGQY
jgi:hypothetical protein